MHAGLALNASKNSLAARVFLPSHLCICFLIFPTCRAPTVTRNSKINESLFRCKCAPRACFCDDVCILCRVKKALACLRCNEHFVKQCFCDRWWWILYDIFSIPRETRRIFFHDFEESVCKLAQMKEGGLLRGIHVWMQVFKFKKKWMSSSSRVWTLKNKHWLWIFVHSSFEIKYLAKISHPRLQILIHVSRVEASTDVRKNGMQNIIAEVTVRRKVD